MCEGTCGGGSWGHVRVQREARLQSSRGSAAGQRRGAAGGARPQPSLAHTHTHTLMHTHTNMHTQIRTACFLPSAKYRSTRRGFKGSHSSPNRRVNILRRSPCYSPSSLSPPPPRLEACHSCDPRCPGQPKVRSQAHYSSTHGVPLPRQSLAVVSKHPVSAPQCGVFI